MAVERIRKGDKVKAGDGSGPVMDVLAVSSHLAICAWQDAGQSREAVMELHSLRRVAAQQQQQAQPVPDSTPAPAAPGPAADPDAG